MRFVLLCFEAVLGLQIILGKLEMALVRYVHDIEYLASVLAAHDRILTLDNIMLRSRPLTNRCCMCCCDGESVNNLLLHCPVTHTL